MKRKNLKNNNDEVYFMIIIFNKKKKLNEHLRDDLMTLCTIYFLFSKNI